MTFIPMAAVDEAGAGIARPQERPFGEVTRGYTYMRDGDVIFAKITPCMQNGKHAIVSNTRTGFAFGSTEFHVLRARDTVHSVWVHHFLLQPSLLREAEHNFAGTAGQRRVPKQFLIGKQIPLPPIDEQRRIVADLERQMAAAGRARRAAEAQLEAALAMPAALLRSVFPSSPATRSRGWRSVALGDVLTVADSGVWGEADPSGVSALRSTNFKGGGILDLSKLSMRAISANHRERKRLEPGDILLERSGGGPTQPVGRVCLFNGDEREHVFGNFCQRLRPDSEACTSQFLFWYLYSFHLRGGTEPFQNRTTGIRNLQYKRYLKQQVPLPPLDEQRRIVADLEQRIAATERAREAAEAQLGDAEALHAAILRRAFGEAA